MELTCRSPARNLLGREQCEAPLNVIVRFATASAQNAIKTTLAPKSANQALPVRSRERPAQRGKAMLSLESLGCAAGQTRRHQEGQDRCRPQARCRSALHWVGGTEFQWGKEKA